MFRHFFSSKVVLFLNRNISCAPRQERMPGLLRKNQKIPVASAQFWVLEHIFFVLSTKMQFF
ncbi:hypothetical protein FO478_02440 [Heyndrickxia coagulans DSM 1 = ATCC 7050]|nr:hypothetical protein [Heyndrickxia coagulans DSM 1 = ATCC 7050]